MIDIFSAKARPRPRMAPSCVDRLEARVLLTRGLPDPTFQGGAAIVAALDPAATPGMQLVQTIPMATGETILVGRVFAVSPESTPGRYSVTRLAPGGTLDPTFGQGGRVIPSATEIEAEFVVNSAAAQEDGKILLVGTTPGLQIFPGQPGEFTQAAVLRLNANGSIDTTYGNDGFARFFFRSGASDAISSAIQRAAVDAQGRLVVSGLVADPDAIGGNLMAFARLTTGGDLDNTFGDGADGTTFLPIAADTPSGFSSLQFAPRSLFVASNGIVAAGTTTIQFSGVTPPSIAITVFRLDANGLPVTTFGDGGSTGIDFLPSGANPSDNVTFSPSAAIDSQGRTIVVGSYDRGIVDRGTAITRLDLTGARDATFGDAATPGLIRRGADGPVFAAVAVAADDALLVAGFSRRQTEPSLSLSRFTPAGRPDESFAPGGLVTTTLASSSPMVQVGPAEIPVFDSQLRVVISGTTSTIGGLVAVERFLSADLTPTPPPVVVAPVVSTLTPVVVNQNLRTVRLFFNAAMNPATIRRPNAFVLVAAGRDGRFGTRDDRRIPLRIPNYNADVSVALVRPRVRVNLRQPLQLTARGTIADVAGNRLVGTAGTPGSSYVVRLGGMPRSS